MGTWQWCDGVPVSIISDIEVNPLYGDVVVSTFGRGIYRANFLENCYTGQDLYINSTLNINKPLVQCSNYVIQNSGSVEISSQVIFAHETSITVKSGGVLNVTGALINANIIVESGGELNLYYNGRIILNNADCLEIKTGGLFNQGEGQVIIKDTYL